MLVDRAIRFRALVLPEKANGLTPAAGPAPAPRARYITAGRRSATRSP